jgi:hypothetical protein
MMTRDEWEQALVMRDRYRRSDILNEAGVLVTSLFGTVESAGMLRLREYARSNGENVLTQILLDLIRDLLKLLAVSRA